MKMTRVSQMHETSGPSMVVTAEEEAGDCVRDRLLLHWVNSLPLTKCLLVEELRDLRFGDVLLEIVQWLQRGPSDAEAICGDGVFENGETVERLRRVVQFVASACRSQDEDAIYIVNNAECVTQVLAGQSDAICAVLTVLKRLGIQRLKDQQSFDSKRDALQRRQVQQEMIKLSLHSRDDAPQVKLDAESESKVKRVHSSSRHQPRTQRNTTKFSKSVRETGSVLNKTKRSRKRPTAVPKRKLSSDPPSTTAKSSTNTSSKKIISKQTDIFHDNHGLRVYGMLDPTAKYQPREQFFDGKCSGCPSNDDEVALRICNWVRLVLQIEIPLNQIFVNQTEKWRLSPPRKVRQVFASGVLLCRIAAAITQRYGGQFVQSVTEDEELSFEALSSVKDPQAPAERQRNLVLALAVFNRIGVSPETVNAFEYFQRPGKPVPSKTIWYALDEVFNRVERLANATAPSNTQHAGISHPETLHPHTNQKKDTTAGANTEGGATNSPKHSKSPQLRRKKPASVEAISSQCVPLKRNMPYITSEQIRVVNEWLTRVGFDMKKSSGHEVLQDPIRNGVLLCSLLNQVLRKTSFSYFKRPRTLSDMRENISTAFERLGDFPQEKIPSCYLTSSAEQAVLIGDRQINYGILWHLWQASRNICVQEPSEGGKRSPKGLHGTRAAVAEATVVASTPMESSPLLFNIPAIALADQEKRKVDVKAPFQVKLHDSFARRLAWSENDPSGDHDDDDLFPVPRAPFSSPVYSAAVDSVLAPRHNENEEKYQNMDDIFPAHAQGVISRSGQEADKMAPRIAIGELSAYPNTVKSPTQANDGISEMPSPIKKLKAHGEQNLMPSQASVEEILVWLKRLGIHLKKASSFHDPLSKLTKFQSGVLLCCIVEKVEFMRTIPGITRPSGKNELSKASALHNISKALAILQQKKTMPLHLLRRANAIYAGDRAIILLLLSQIRKAYGHHHVPRRRSTQHSPAA